MEENIAVFLDRDGVICEDADHLSNEKDIRLFPKSGEAIKMLNNSNYKVIIVTNQAAIARGLLTEEKLDKIHGHLIKLLKSKGASIDGIYYCPHHPTIGKSPEYVKECDCRKPKIGMFLQAKKDFMINNFEDCFMIGDKTSDIKAETTIKEYLLEFIKMVCFF